MQTKRIQCPNCKVILDVKNSKDEEVKQISCPKCKSLLKVTFDLQQTPEEPVEAHTFYAAPQKPSVDSGATQLSAGSFGATQLAAASHKSETQAKLMFGLVSYPLKEGQNIVGRMGSTSKATVQIETTDRYMSRQHCCITVTKLPDGTIKAVLSNYQNKNLTTVDGEPIETGDQIRLTNFNKITMGMTTVTFKLS